MFVGLVDKYYIYMTRMSIDDKQTLLPLSCWLSITLEDLLKPYQPYSIVRPPIRRDRKMCHRISPNLIYP